MRRQSTKAINLARKRFTALKSMDIKKPVNPKKGKESQDVSLECEEDFDEPDNLLSSTKVVTSIKRPAYRGPRPRKRIPTQNKEIDIGSEEENDTDRRLEENEQFIIELLSRTQPHQDHSYTSIFGKKRGIEFIAHDDQAEEPWIEPSDAVLYAGKIVICPKVNREPILCLGNVSVMDELTGPGTDEASKTIIVCSEEIVDEEKFEIYIDADGHNGESKEFDVINRCIYFWWLLSNCFVYAFTEYV